MEAGIAQTFFVHLLYRLVIKSICRTIFCFSRKSRISCARQGNYRKHVPSICEFEEQAMPFLYQPTTRTQCHVVLGYLAESCFSIEHTSLTHCILCTYYRIFLGTGVNPQALHSIAIFTLGM